MDMILYSNRALCVDIIFPHHHVEAHALNGATNDAFQWVETACLASGGVCQGQRLH